MKPEIAMSSTEKKTCCCSGGRSSAQGTEVMGDASKAAKDSVCGTVVEAAAKSGPTGTLAART